MSIKFNKRNIFYQRPIVINKISTTCGSTCKNYYHQHNVQRTTTAFILLFIFSESYSSNFYFLTVSVHSSTNLSTIFFQQLQVP